MGCEAGRWDNTCATWPTKTKEAPSPHEVRLTPLDTNPVFQCFNLVQEPESKFNQEYQ